MSTIAVPAAEAPAEKASSYAWYALAILTAVYVLNFLDRTLIYILFTPIKKEMAFSDLQLALLGTTSFVIFYTLLGIPFGVLADYVNRKTIIAAGLATWSLFSGLTGFAHTFWTLFLCRLMVGVGEATLGPAALSLLSDLFPPRKRGTVQAIYASGIALGGGLAFLLGGWIGQFYGWRNAFFIVGFPGLVLAVAVALLREPARGRTETTTHYGASDWRAVLRSAPLRYLYLGYAMVGLASNNMGIWLPTFFVRIHHLSLAWIGAGAGILSLLVGMPVMVFGGYYSDRVSRVIPGGRMAFTAWVAAASVPLWFAMLYLQTLTGVLIATVLLYALALIWVGAATADVHDLCGPKLRGLGIGIFFSIVNIASYGLGAPLIGRFSDVLGVTAHPEQMRVSLLVGPAACAVGAVLLWMGSRARARSRAAVAL